MNVKVVLILGAAMIAIGCANSSTAPLSKHAAKVSIECRTGYFIRGGVNGAPPDTVCNGDQ